tara:strand:- start:3807 stop:4103 length:297 start_codon:yes stop_codon:yes gene_type:complete
MNVIYQGHIATDGTTKITCTGESMTIVNIIINNLDSNYVITVDRFMTGPGIHKIPLYEFSLDAGDSVRDTEEYILYTGDYIQLNSDVVGTTFYINTEQ